MKHTALFQLTHERQFKESTELEFLKGSVDNINTSTFNCTMINKAQTMQSREKKKKLTPDNIKYSVAIFFNYQKQTLSY